MSAMDGVKIFAPKDLLQRADSRAADMAVSLGVRVTRGDIVRLALVKFLDEAEKPPPLGRSVVVLPAKGRTKAEPEAQDQAVDELLAAIGDNA